MDSKREIDETIFGSEYRQGAEVDAMRDIFMQIIEVLRGTDRDHPMTQGEIAEKVKGPSGKPIDRKTVNAAFKDLKEELDLVDLKKQGWYLDTREGISYEMALLIGEAIMLSPHMSEADRLKATGLLAGLFSTYDNARLKEELRKVEGPAGGIPVNIIEDIHEAIREGQPLLIKRKDGSRVHLFPRYVFYKKELPGLALYGYKPFGVPEGLPLDDIETIEAQEMKDYMRDERGILVEGGPFVLTIDGLPYYSFSKEELTEKEAKAAFADFRYFLGRNTVFRLSYEEALSGRLVGNLARLPFRYGEKGIRRQLQRDLKVFFSYLLLKGNLDERKEKDVRACFAEASASVPTSSSGARMSNRRILDPVAFAHLVRSPFIINGDWRLSGSAASIPDRYPLDGETFGNLADSIQGKFPLLLDSRASSLRPDWYAYPLCYYLYDKRHRTVFRERLLKYIDSWDERDREGRAALRAMGILLTRVLKRKVLARKALIAAEIGSLPVE